EAEEDYGYIIDPDLVISEIGSEWIENIRNEMPELAQDKVRKFIEKYRISKEDAQILASEKALAEMFEKVAGAVDPGLAAKWLRRELLRVLNYSRKSLDEVGITEKHMIDLLRLVQEKKITDNVASRLLEKLVENAFDIVSYVKKEALEAVSDADVLEKYCIEAIKENPVAVEDYRKGEAKSLNFIVGQVMRKTKGKAAPKEVNEIILRILNESQ
ncbi:Asp-tRNA(Asn)/Glu-tRNA(Gln) amidotransferase GatCAB subunit B, partial [Candidatus Woesearchaeota archaeon]|nr:Asp-tRNA(Asn)/Glu-tRNA(Gln) amidotransferase GatCAB subunit B [Candidatus Woesearchaeota archaeon]